MAPAPADIRAMRDSIRRTLKSPFVVGLGTVDFPLLSVWYCFRSSGVSLVGDPDLTPLKLAISSHVPSVPAGFPSGW